MSEKHPKEDDKQSRQLLDIVERLIEKSPDPLGKILDTVSHALTGHPEEIKADYRVTLVTTIGFLALMFSIVVVTTWLAAIGKLGGETVAFVFGTAFGSIITFMFKYLAPSKED
jgi:hypothetical protein